MHRTNSQKIQKRTSNFYQTRCGEADPSSAQICAALLARAPDLRPNAFSTLKSQIVADQLARGHVAAAEEIRQLINPVTAPGSTLDRKPKLNTVKKVSKEDTEQLFKHLRAHGHHDEAAALVLAYFLGVRPCEMRTILVVGNEVRIIGGKKSAPLHRGADRTLLIEIPKILKAIRWAAKRLAESERTNTAIRDRFRQECRALWPRRKKHPTLKSFRQTSVPPKKPRELVPKQPPMSWDINQQLHKRSTEIVAQVTRVRSRSSRWGMPICPRYVNPRRSPDTAPVEYWSELRYPPQRARIGRLRGIE